MTIARHNPAASPVLGLILFPVLFLAGCTGDVPQLTHGEPVPTFSLEAVKTNRPLNFPDALRGRIVAIRFWADWCPFCAPEMKALEPVFQRYRERGLAIVAINVRQGRETARAFADELGLTYDVLLDREGEVARAYGVMGLPTTFFVDREGRLRARILGESSGEVFEKIVSKLVTEE
uniref:Peroxiredoxin n=1 Tax=Candidatus Kentrum sp. DK TaxID=2126562 RepID=A0A450S541_9GAMM|nr:MAG: Peroxiredoxin [Candidatus Kentron sp. DK]VFJ47014.1 MAG: Peroxiredoxin [Candidatus Kentron sp. DK]